MKKQCGLKRYYRNLATQNDFDGMEFDSIEWFDMWHLHFDWKGYGNNSFKRRKPHLDKLFRHFEILEAMTKEYKQKFQLFAVIWDYASDADSLYFHTPNPNSGLPLHCGFPVDYSKDTYFSTLSTLTNKDVQIYLDDLVGYINYTRCPKVITKPIAYFIKTM